MSDIIDARFSDLARAPLKPLPTTSEGTRLTCANFPAPLLTESVIETTSDRDFATPLRTTSEIVDARLSDVVLNPEKSLDAASEMVGASERDRNPAKSLARMGEGTRRARGKISVAVVSVTDIEE